MCGERNARFFIQGIVYSIRKKEDPHYEKATFHPADRIPGRHTSDWQSGRRRLRQFGQRRNR